MRMVLDMIWLLQSTGYQDKVGNKKLQVFLSFEQATVLFA